MSPAAAGEQPFNSVGVTCLADADYLFLCSTHDCEHSLPEDRAGVTYVGLRRYKVTCDVHGLDRIVNTPEHAQNLVALHNVRDHPETADNNTVDLSAAAQWLLLIHADPNLHPSPSWTAVLCLWEQLTGVHGADAVVELARRYRDTPTHAAVVPF